LQGYTRGQKVYIQRGAVGFPRGIFDTLLSLHHSHTDFSTIPSTMVWVDQGSVSQLLPSPYVTHGTDRRNPEVRRSGRIYGRQRGKELTRDVLTEILKVCLAHCISYVTCLMTQEWGFDVYCDNRHTGSEIQPAFHPTGISGFFLGVRAVKVRSWASSVINIIVKNA